MPKNDAVVEARDAAEQRIRRLYAATVIPARRKRDFGIKQVFRICDEVKRQATSALLFAEKILAKDSWVLDEVTREATLENIRAGYEWAIHEAVKVRTASTQVIVDDYENTVAQADQASEAAQAKLRAILSQYQESRTSTIEALANL